MGGGSCRYLRLNDRNRTTLTMIVTRRCGHTDERRRVSGGPTKDHEMSTQVVLITGGLTGIGRAAAVAFAKKGAKVAVAGRRDEAGQALVKELRSFGSEAEFIKADGRKENDVRALVDKTLAQLGGLHI